MTHLLLKIGVSRRLNDLFHIHKTGVVEFCLAIVSCVFSLLESSGGGGVAKLKSNPLLMAL